MRLVRDALCMLLALLGIVVNHGAIAQAVIEYPVPTPSSESLAIIVGPDGNLWFTEYTGNKIGRITPAGVITEFPIPTPASHPGNIAVGPDGNLWFTENATSKIGRITMAGAITEFSLAPARTPWGIAAAPDGNLYFTEQVPRAFGRITTAGVVTEYNSIAPVGPNELTLGSDGNLWYSSAGIASGIGRLSQAGVYSLFPVVVPTALTPGPQGAIWFTTLDNKVGRVTTAGTITLFPGPTTLSSPNGIAAGADGNLWYTQGLPVLIRMTPAGVVTQCAIPHPGFGIVSGPDNALWIAAYDRIVRFTLPTGDCPIFPPASAAQIPTLSVWLVGTLIAILGALGTVALFGQRKSLIAAHARRAQRPAGKV